METMFGLSLRQGPHQDAQKSKNTTFPLKSDSLNWFPSGDSIEKSGALSPIFSPSFCVPESIESLVIKLKHKQMHVIKSMLVMRFIGC